MENKTIFKQIEFHTDKDVPSGYLLIVEIVNGIAIKSFIVELPKPFLKFPRNPYINN